MERALGEAREAKGLKETRTGLERELNKVRSGVERQRVPDSLGLKNDTAHAKTGPTFKALQQL